MTPPANAGRAHFRRVVGFAEAEVAEICGEDLRHFEFFRFGETQRDPACSQTLADLITEPGGVAKLEGEADVRWQQGQVFAEAGEVYSEGRRELVEHRAQTTSGAQRFERAQEDFREGTGILQFMMWVSFM